MDVPGPPSARSLQAGHGRGPVRRAAGLVSALDPGGGGAQEGGQAIGHHMGGHPAPSRSDVRTFSVDVLELDIPAGGRSGRRWQMADEVLYVLSGSGYSLHWEVEAEIADMYYARIATEPSRHEVKAGDTLYVPQNTVAQHFAVGSSPLRLLSAQNRLFKQLGYDAVVYLESSTDRSGLPSAAAASVDAATR